MYRELAPPPALRPYLVCTWEERSGAARTVPVVPDGCVDLLWNGAQLTVAGPDTRTMLAQCAVDARFTAVRLRPGCAGAILGVPAFAVRDARVLLSELWGERAHIMADALADAPDEASRRAVLLQAVAAQSTATPLDRLVLTLVQRLEHGRPPEPRIAQLARELGISERQLNRRCSDAVGYGPKLLARILRLQAFKRSLRTYPERSIAALATTHGYVDQAHVAHDARQLFATTPAQLRERR